MAWRDEEDFKALKRIIHAEFKAVIVPFLTNGVNPPMDRE
jgi:hypothetical protein